MDLTSLIVAVNAVSYEEGTRGKNLIRKEGKETLEKIEKERKRKKK